MNVSTLYGRDVVAEFQDNPVGWRVVLPDGGLAVVKRFEDTDQGRIFKVQGVHRNGRFRALNSVSCWFSADEVRLVYYSASIRNDWAQS